MPQLFIVLMAFVGLFGVGSYWRGGEKPLNVSTKQFAANAPNSSKNPVSSLPPGNANSNDRQLAQTNPQIAAQKQDLTTKQPAKQLENAPNAAVETVYFCGAQTKKGTPCSRRVKGGGRCWQHKGQIAMLPPEKLIAGQ